MLNCVYVSSVMLSYSTFATRRETIYLVIFHPTPLTIFFASLILTPHREVTHISNSLNPASSPNPISVTPNWNLKNSIFNLGNPFWWIARLLHNLKVESVIMEVCAEDVEAPMICNDMRFESVDNSGNEAVESAIWSTRVKEVR